ncbi:florfenicol exporter [Aspergillus sclerotioniger CBS 115572]|uniref:Citrate exporter 1 n=1 Tax=Aspergillus sclerotioniger CBS 115572 TaxID=1450535 RepID=A0A317WKY2_9EURO|nr:florfenicol exporter [Aspergillus sclerotioniger CBS 115572]PWY85717.1 florfenicol exporter [Aspergillus sclerotioniger CBS 115572]
MSSNMSSRTDIEKVPEPQVTPKDHDSERDSISPEPSMLESQPSEKPPHHIFTRSRKLQMVGIVSLAAIFSPLSSNIYFPALDDVSQSLHISMSLATLTITVYMIVQGLAPSFWGSLSDATGRRPVFIGTFIVYLIANIALGESQNYGELMAFRALQAAGSAATISIGAGVIGDITTSEERGSLVGIFGGVRMLGQGIGPVFGGIFTQYFGYRSIFWFLTAFGGVSLLSIMVLLPETLRPIAGNGTVKLTGMHKPIIYSITGQKGVIEGAQPDARKGKVTWRAVFAPLTFLIEKDVFITLFFGSVVYTVWSMVTSSTTDLFSEVYGLSSLQIGLTFLGNGFGCMSGSYLVGYLMDYNHRLTEREYCEQHGYPAGTRVNLKSHSDFPIEVARMRNTWWVIAIFVVATALYGVSLRTHLAVPIILQYFIAFCSTGLFTINSALVIDLYPGASASATAVNNLMRCLLGAGGVAVVQLIIDALTAEYTFILLAGITLAMTPLLYIEDRWGPSWRHARERRLKAKANGN